MIDVGRCFGTPAERRKSLPTCAVPPGARSRGRVQAGRTSPVPVEYLQSIEDAPDGSDIIGDDPARVIEQKPQRKGGGRSLNWIGSGHAEDLLRRRRFRHPRVC